MQFINAQAGQNVAMNTVREDESVHTALQMTQNIVKDEVYMWCSRPVSTHEALGIIIEYTKWETRDMYISSAEIAKAVKAVFGVKISSPTHILSRSQVLALLGKTDLHETVSCSFRYLVPGEYYLDHGVDPSKKVLSRFIETEYSILDTSYFYLHTFGTDRFFFITKSGFMKLRPTQTNSLKWENISKRFRFGDVTQGLDTTIRFRQLTETMRFHRVVEKSMTYLKVLGRCIYIESSFDNLITAFADSVATPEWPMLRFTSTSLGSTITRLHKSVVQDPVFQTFLESDNKKSLQVVFRVPGTSSPMYAFLEVLPDKFYVSTRLSSRANIPYEAFENVFSIINNFLKDISPLYTPLTKSLVMLNYANHTTKLSKYVPTTLDMWFWITITAQKKMCTANKLFFKARDGAPVVIPINMSDNERTLNLQFLRSCGMSKEILIKNFILKNLGSSKQTLLQRITKDYSISAQDCIPIIDDVFQNPYAYVSNVPVVKVNRKSDITTSLRIESIQDIRYIDIIQKTIGNLLEECSDQVKSKAIIESGSVMKSMSLKVQSQIGELDDFLDMVNISEPDHKAISFDRNEESLGVGSDVLRTLQRREPNIFMFKSDNRYRAYSVLCQDRQPIILNPDEFKEALKKSTDGSLGDVITYGSTPQKHVYACPEKWCIISGVARKKRQQCPVRDEPYHETCDALYPGYISASKNPNGLCMPCCFQKKPIQGSKIHKRNEDCQNAGNDVSVSTNSNLIKSSHLSRAQRILDFGDMGNLSPLIKRLFPEQVVRHGMGVQSSFFQCMAFLMKNNGFLNDFRSKVKFNQYIQGHHMVRPTNLYPIPFAKWWKTDQAKEYRTVFSLPQRLSKSQSQRELFMYSMYHERHISPDSGHERWLGIMNTSPGIPHVVVIDTEDDTFVSLSVTPVLESKNDIRFLLKTGKVYEPLGMYEKKTFESQFSKDASFVKNLIYTKSYHFQLEKDIRRIVNTRFMVVGLMDSSGGGCAVHEPFCVDFAYPHIHASDIPSTSRISKSLPSQLFKITDHAFYKHDYQQSTSNLITDAYIDLQILYNQSVTDKRHSLLKEFQSKMKLEQEHAARIWELVSQNENLTSEKSTKDKIRTLRTKYKSRLPNIPDHVIDFIIERLIRPMPTNVIPIIKQTPDEVLTL